MEGFKEVNKVAGQESLSGVEKAQEILLELETFNGTTIVGQEALNQVEGLARELDAILDTLPESLRQISGLPRAANEDNYQLTANS